MPDLPKLNCPNSVKIATQKRAYYNKYMAVSEFLRIRPGPIAQPLERRTDGDQRFTPHRPLRQTLYRIGKMGLDGVLYTAAFLTTIKYLSDNPPPRFPFLP